MTLKNSVQVATGVVKVNGEAVEDADKTSHVEVIPKSGSTTEGKRIMFRQLSKGFTKEVKLTR